MKVQSRFRILCEAGFSVCLVQYLLTEVSRIILLWFSLTKLADGSNLQLSTGLPKKILPRLYGCCGGAADSIVSIFTQLNRSRFNVEFEILVD